MEHLARMLNERGYLVVANNTPNTLEPGDIEHDVNLISTPTSHPAHIICETDYLDMNAQWPDEPNLYTAEEAKCYRFYRVSLD